MKYTMESYRVIIGGTWPHLIYLPTFLSLTVKCLDEFRVLFVLMNEYFFTTFLFLLRKKRLRLLFRPSFFSDFFLWKIILQR